MRRFLLPVALALALAWVVPASADQLGDTESFNVNKDYDAEGSDEISATLRALGSTVYLYVDDRHWSSMNASERSTYTTELNELVGQFDGTIHPRSVAFWGHENDPGVDDDSHVTILLQKLIAGAGGYFETIHSYSEEQASQSNAREMFVVSAASVSGRRDQESAAHEFQHLISFNQKELSQGRQVSDDVWLNELRSEYNVTVSGYAQPYAGSSLQSRAFAFSRTPSDSLTEWPNTGTDYAIATIFGHYLVDRYGPSMVQHTIHARSPGVKAIDEWLEQEKRSERFREVFGDWMSAVIVNDPNDVRYSYRTTGLSGLRITPSNARQVTGSSGATWNLALKEWQPEWVRATLPFSGTLPPSLVLQVSGEPGIDWGGTYIAVYEGTTKVLPWRSTNGSTIFGIPTSSEGRRLSSVTFSIAQGTDRSTEGRVMDAKAVSVAASLGDAPPLSQSSPSPTPSSSVQPPAPSQIKDGDLIHRPGQKEVYVIWGKYRRYLMPGVLELYGFQTRPVIEVPDDVFANYTTSNYIRQVDTEPVYAVWPDATKHHFAITPAQWDAAGRDWNSIFIVNEREAAFYATGEDITR